MAVMSDEALKIEQLQTVMNAVGGALRIMSRAEDIGDDMAETLHLLADVLEHPEVVS